MRKILFILVTLAVSSAFSQTQEVWLQSRMDGTYTLLDDTEVTFWGYGYNNPGQNETRIFLPAPILRFNLGDTVVIHLQNNSPEDHTIHWHGLDVDQENDGVGHTSTDVHSGEEFTYTFVCDNSGTYLYHCHVLTTLHLAMGMYGLFIVNGENEYFLYGADTKFTKEFSFLFSEMNTSWNSTPTSPGPFHLYEADYLLVNGVSGVELEDPDHIVHGDINDTLAFRFANIGYGSVDVIFPEELSVTVHASDGRPILAFETDTLKLFPGERYDVIALPTGAFTGIITANYFDLRNNNLLGSNTVPVIIDGALSIDDVVNSESGITIYPNPFDHSFVLNQTHQNEQEIVLYDLSGKVVHRQMVNFGKNIISPNLNPGIYFIESGQSRKKLIRN